MFDFFFCDKLFARKMNRPGFDRDDFAANGHIFLDINGPIDSMIPDGRIVGTIDHIDLYFNSTR